MTVLVVSVVAALLAAAVIALATLLRRQRALGDQVELLRCEFAAASAREQSPRAQEEPAPEPVPVVTDLARVPMPAPPPPSLRVSASLAEPLISVLAFAHGLRAIADEETRMRVGYAFRKELRHQRRIRRHGVIGRARHGWGAR